MAMKILVVDDHPIVRAGCQRMLKQAFGAEIIEASTCPEACRLAQESKPDVVVLDLTLPGASGLEVLDKLRLQNDRLRVLVFSMHHNPVFAARAIQSGARGYVVKSAPPEELLAAVHEILAGGIYLSRELAKEIALVALCDEADPLKELSNRELEILRLFGKGNDLATIAAALCLSYKTVANNVTRIKVKLRVHHTGELVRLAIERGLTDSVAGIKSPPR
jgi:two-component system, NarL family, invasion response regulator UvrY